MFFCMTNHPQTAMVPARHVVLLTSQRLEYLTTPPTGNLELGCHSDINCYIELVVDKTNASGPKIVKKR